MAKSTYLSGLLPFLALLFSGYVVGPYVRERQPVSGLAESRLFKAETSALRSAIKLVYDREIGTKEATGKNDGKRIEEYLGYVSAKKGDPWCAAFVCWVYHQLKLPNPKSGWSPALMAFGRKVRKGNRRSDLLPKRGDVFGIWFPGKGRVAHVGFVDEFRCDFLITVEGNTNLAGSREGDGVYRKRRPLNTIYQIVSYLDD